MTIREATEAWVKEWDFIQAGLIQDAINGKEYVWNELTPLTAGDSVCFWDGTNLKDETYDGYGEIEKIDNEKVVVRVSSTGDKVVVDKGRVEVEGREWFPAWYILFQPKDNTDEYFIRENLQKVADCGFRIYEHDDYGIYLGIDGAGYDFYEAHWIPLYRSRGLQWHDERTEHTADDIRKMLADAGVSSEIIESVMTIPIGSNIKIGGYHGGYLSKDDRTSIKKCGHFIVEERHEKIQEMNGLVDNDYCIVKREI